jgi:hypothetical protein
MRRDGSGNVRANRGIESGGSDASVFVLDAVRDCNKTRQAESACRWKSSDPKMPHGISFRRGDDL